MPTNTITNNLKINKLTKAQYEQIQNPSQTELYLVPDETDSNPTPNSTNYMTSGDIYLALLPKANKSEMTITDGTGADIDKTTIQLKSGLSTTVLKSHQDISGKEDKVDIVLANGDTLSAEVGKYYRLTNVGTLAITLPTIAVTNSTVQTVSFYINAGSSPAVTFTSTHNIYYADGFEIAANSTYEVNALWNGAAWIVASVKIIIPS